MNHNTHGHLIGAGAFSIVHRVMGPNGHYVAVKRVPLAGNASSSIREEVESAMASSAGPVAYYFVEYFNCHVQNDAILITMEYSIIGSLEDYVTAGRLGEDAHSALHQMAKALKAMHEAGIVHGNLKPSNVLVFPAREGKIALKLSDYGLSKGASPFATIGYVAPEVLQGKEPHSEASDIYSLGGILHFMLTGGHPPVSQAFSEDGRPQFLIRSACANLNGGQTNKMYLYSRRTLMNRFPAQREATFKELIEYKGQCKISARSSVFVDTYECFPGGSVIFVKNLSGATIVVRIDLGAKVEELKERIEMTEDIPSALQRLIFSGKQLEDGRTLSDYRLQEKHTIHLLLRLTGC